MLVYNGPDGKAYYSYGRTHNDAKVKWNVPGTVLRVSHTMGSRMMLVYNGLDCSAYHTYGRTTTRLENDGIVKRTGWSAYYAYGRTHNDTKMYVDTVPRVSHTVGE